jgi:predicted ferric reductase
MAVGIISARAARRALGYQAWYRLHLLTYLAVGLAFSHQLTNGTDLVYHPVTRALWIAMYAFGAAAAGYYRLVRPVWEARRHRMTVSAVVPEAGGAISISLTARAVTAVREPVRPVIEGAQAGQFFRLRFLTRGRWWQSHPFSLSAAPTAHTLRFTVKALGDHTAGLRDLPLGTAVLASGPFGALTARRRRERRVLMIGAGIGIAPLRALFEVLPADRGDLTLIYRSRAESELTFREELDELARRRGAVLHYVVGPRVSLRARSTRGAVGCRTARRRCARRPHPS